MLLGSDDIDALVTGRHRDPFAVLGPHRAADGRWWLRALLPGAVAVEALSHPGGRRLASFEQRDEAGLFETPLSPRHRADAPPPYRLRVQWAHGGRDLLADPYAFGPLIGEGALAAFAAGSHKRPDHVLGAHPMQAEGVAGTRFAVWAPNAQRVAVVGDFNAWDPRRHPMRLRHAAGVWELFVPHAAIGDRYKFALLDAQGRALPLKADPYALAAELRPATASVVSPRPARSLPAGRAERNQRRAPVSIYEVHLGSWQRADDGGFLGWDELAARLPAYAAELGFTHLELLPVAEHPFDGSWGYQVTGQYAPSSRFGDPAGFGRFIDACHAQGLGLLVDWVPAHFPSDAHALARFDGTALYEYADPREGFHKDWNTLIYNFARHEVKSFLVGSALHWLQDWGLDGLRVDAVASMLYRDYSRQPGEWLPNAQGGRENLEAVALLRELNTAVGSDAPGAVVAAEESTAWPGVSRPVSMGGLGFHYKWNMGWMHDTLKVFQKDPIHRRHHHNELSFSLVYAFDENFILPLSHDEVVHGKGSLINKMPGDAWQQFANLRALLGWQWTHPGKKLLFMGCEFAQRREWNFDAALDWHLLDDARHRGIQQWVRDLNRLYRERPALHARDCEAEGFEWICADDAANSVLAFLRHDGEGRSLLVALNLTPLPREGYRLGVNGPGRWREILNSDAALYGGSNLGNGLGPVAAEAVPAHGRAHSIAVLLPPLALVVFEPMEDAR
ncbi:1,4-alpha-glucan branching protein GlgB [Rivibacter subsaxonicus]|uniref:1,4-alpha-glucan branching enzyme GlgB n=1 Tax=Rivibacter subsaxonicus TaxID=457575 RepID=A0A4Q7V9L6_9BURK|nr:1,4-alpha-glucan branching protein GlgB [Rivibacter subsaxonicus]RZT91983.1 1,4-alpha-glucan branching enzyme [Rivibacter subsaxonicus]